MSFDTDLLSELIGRKHQSLLQLRLLGRKQLELIENSDLTQLLKLLASKQKLLTDLESLERRLDPFRMQDPEARIWRTADDRNRCAQIAAESETIRAEIAEVERMSETRLTLRRDEAATRLQGMHQASQVRHAYAEPTTNQWRQLDLSSEG